MFFSYKQLTNVIQIDDAFAHLVSVLDNGDMQFELTYSVSLGQAASAGAQKVLVSVVTRNISPVTVLGASYRGFIDVQAIVNNIRTTLPTAKALLRQYGSYIVAQVTSDITAYASPMTLSRLVAGAASSTIPDLTTVALQSTQAIGLKQANDPQPVLHVVSNSAIVPDVPTALSGSFRTDPQRLIDEMVVRQGLDPTYVFSLTPRSSPELQTLGGMSNPQRAHELATDPASELLGYYLFPPGSVAPPTTSDDVTDVENVQVLVPQTTDVVEVPVMVTLSAAALQLDQADVTQVFVKFDLLNANSGEPVDTVVKVIDLTKELQVYNTPKLPPALKAAKSEVSSRVNLEIKQVDPGASAVQVYKKSVWVASPETDEYTLQGTYNLTSRDQSLLVQVDRPLMSSAQYRVIALGRQANQGFDFSNVVVTPTRYTPRRSVALVASQVDNGIKLEVRHIPRDVVAIQLLRWNATTFDSTYTTVNGDVSFVDAATRQADLVSTIDLAVFANNVYRYVARLIYVDGLLEDFGDATLEFIKPSPGQVSTTLTNVQVNHTDVPNVTFDITTSTVATDLDVIKALLGEQGSLQYFQGDVTAQRAQLQALIAHNVQRVDLDAGIREDFGVVTASAFDDTSLQKMQAVSPLRYGHRYRYEVYPLLRSPETLFDLLTNDTVDPGTQKPYSYSPSKYFHPMALNQGTIVTSLGASQRYVKDPMSFGVVGSIVSVEVSFDAPSAIVSDAVATRFDRYLNVITWKVQGDVSLVDHFVIMKQVHGIRTLVGKSHSEFPYGSCQYLHAVTSHDDGDLSYVIVPVMNDFSVQASATTNVVTVNSP